MNSFTIATFNINKNDGDFPNRIYNLAQVIDKSNIDILVLQEDFDSENFSSSDIVNKSLSCNKITIKTREKVRDNITSSSNLTILSHFESIDTNSIYFNENPNEQRAALFNKFIIDEKEVLIVNTHLCHLSSTNRLFQIKKILEYIDSMNINNIILCGDMNSTPDSDEVQLIQKNGYKYFNEQITAQRGKIIDYIFVRGNVKSSESQIILEGYSDHYCVLNTIELF